MVYYRIRLASFQRYRVFFSKGPTQKVLSMELVPLNRIKWLSALVPPKATRRQAMVRRAVRKMKHKAQACVAVGGGVFEGRKL